MVFFFFFELNREGIRTWNLLKVCVAKALEYHFLTASSKVPGARPRLNAKWDKPPPDWYELNTDASIINGHAGAGGLLRDSNGNWVQGFSKPLGTATVLMAKLWASREGLCMARQLNIYNLIVNVDSSDVVKLITFGGRDILQVFQQVQLSHCYREANHAADLHAKIGSSQCEDFVYYVTPPVTLLDVLAFDCASDSALYVPVNSELL